LTEDRFGNANSAYSFDGVDDVITFSSPFTTVIDNFTISAWVKKSTITSGGQIVSNGRNPGNGFPANLYDGYSYASGGNSLSANYHAVASPSAGCPAQSIDWEFVVLVRESGVTKLYLNGIQCPNTFTNTPIVPTQDAFIGALNGNNIAPFEGAIDDVKIYNVALTAEQVFNEFEDNLPPPIVNYGSQFENNVLMNGTSDYILIPHNAALSLSDFTIEAWIKVSPQAGFRRIIRKTAENELRQNYTLGIHEGKAFVAFDRIESNGFAYVEGSISVDDDEWHFLSGTFNLASGELKIYVDGILDSTTITTFIPMTSTETLKIGAAAVTNTTQRLAGKIDEVRIWNTTRSISQIQNTMNAPLTGSETGLVGYWDMNRDGQGVGLTVDNETFSFGSALNGTTFGTDTTPIFTPSGAQFKPGSGNALVLNGSQYVFNTNQLSTTNNFTIEAWVNPSTTTTIHSQSTSGVAVGDNRFAIHPTHGVFLGSGSLFAGAGFSVGTNGICVFEHAEFYAPVLLSWSGTISGWTHVAVVYTNKQPSLFVNGVLVATGLTSLRDQVFASTRQIGGGSLGFFQGEMDEVRVWDSSFTETQIRERMCRKIAPSDPLQPGLILNYNFDESFGSICFNLGSHSENGVTVVEAARVVSGASIGNASAFNYSGNSASASLTNPERGDVLTAILNSGNASGLQIYCVSEAPNLTDGQDALPDNNGYFGAFIIGDANAGFSAFYNYDSIELGINIPDFLGIYHRPSNAASGWTIVPATNNVAGNTLNFQGIAGEYMIGLGDTLPPVTPVTQIVAAEYFINSDPGVGDGIPITITPGINIAESFSFNTDTLPAGLHAVYVRVQYGDGTWGLAQSRTFQIAAPPPVSPPTQIVAAEFFIDTDPGLGNGTPIAVTSGSNILEDFSFIPDTLPGGLHAVSVRVQYSDGTWSLTATRLFRIAAEPVTQATQIVAAEMFFNTDPGIGNADVLYNGPPVDSLNLSQIFVPFNAPFGAQHLYVRVLDNLDKWSLYEGIGPLNIDTCELNVPFQITQGGQLFWN
jgi:hypothetical protein